MSEWIEMSEGSLPPEGEIVMTRDSSAHETTLKRIGRLFYFPDMSMYVYYTPRAWRPLTDAEVEKEIAEIEAKADAKAKASRAAIEAIRKSRAAAKIARAQPSVQGGE
ncbi:hypothetical protein LMG6871_02879 [Ralstonia edaphis]|uniref:hypothetical protein n=1 Tax=Ralstonia edaphi TaxID=3058599 RepID=UPI0028F5077E|nr:hypothetical protein [Ralstonia sp. LMG 6871]CAJ0719460.1 hypothetical protein LMG6871_02879 [Ralstonia sp. LMG 6871]